MTKGPIERREPGARRLARRVAAFTERHRIALAVAQWTCFVVSCAGFAGFVRLPEIAVPAYVGLALTGLRYAVWEGVAKPWLMRDPPA